MSTPYVGFGNDTLNKMPKVSGGDPIICPSCQGVHNLQCATKDGTPTDLLMFYKCNGKAYIGAVSGRLVAGIKADVSGRV